MAERKPFLLRLDPAVHAQLQRWADDELRSLNGQIEFLLRDALRRSGRGSVPTGPADGERFAKADPTGEKEERASES